MADEGYEYTPNSVTVNSKPVTGRSFYATENSVVSASFRKKFVKKYNLTISTNSSYYEITADKSSYAEGETVTLTANKKNSNYMLKSVYYWLNGTKTQISLDTLKFAMPTVDIEIVFECVYAPSYNFNVKIIGADDNADADKYTVKVNGKTLSNNGSVEFQPGSLKFELFDDKGNKVPWENVSYVRLCDSKGYTINSGFDLSMPNEDATLKITLNNGERKFTHGGFKHIRNDKIILGASVDLGTNFYFDGYVIVAAFKNDKIIATEIYKTKGYENSAWFEIATNELIDYCRFIAVDSLENLKPLCPKIQEISDEEKYGEK